ncbi:MAG: serine hydrolase [Alphaproteobacteria bacterium]|nr:serine hydrolase [Alphaproteobacteria bacterium]
MNIDIRGRTAPGFEPVREAFAANFARDDLYRDVGASLAVYRGNECLVDLWGGSADAEGTRPWTRDTLVNVWSTTKGITAIALAVLVDRGGRELPIHADVVGKRIELRSDQRVDVLINDLDGRDAVVVVAKEAPSAGGAIDSDRPAARKGNAAT